MTRTHRYWLALAALTVLSSGCSGSRHRILDREIALGTDDDLDRRFHRLAHDQNALGLRFPGYLIGVEKANRARLGVPSKAGLDDEPWIDSHYVVSLEADKRGATIVKSLRSRFDDGERTFISHVVSSDFAQHPVPRLRNRFLYNAYAPGSSVDDGRAGSTSAMSRAREALSLLRDDIQARVAADQYTHFIVMSMGWNTDQEESIRNFNSLHANLLEAAGDSPWKPLFIGLTWPSLWDGLFGSVGSYDNKAGDADEIGASWANLVVNWILPSVMGVDGRRLKIVCVGHSFGARIMSRAAFSAGFVAGSSDDVKVDALVLLQAAFSANRFLKARTQGKEGAPYAGYATEVGRIVATWSEHDTANPIANSVSGANLIGGRPGYERASDPDYRAHFDFRSMCSDGSIVGDDSWRQSSKVIMIDASKVIKSDVWGSGGNAHSDIYTEEVGRFLWDAIKDV